MPIDYRASAEFLARVADIVDARVLLVGEAVDHGAIESARPIWSLVDLRSDRIERRTRVTPAPEITADDTAEIIFTSGATAEPKGVVITHRNILANIVPIEREMAKYRSYMRPFLPIRFLNLLPLSHMFGQAMATFIPPMLPGRRRLHAQLRARRHRPADPRRGGSRCSCACRRSSRCCASTSIRVCTRRRRPSRRARCTGSRRWWHYRRVHRLFGLKFWAFVVGAAPLDPALEAFWGRLGFVVVQGYGLTETAPIVTLNHPLRAAQGLGRQADRRRRGEDRRRRRDPRARRERDARLLQRAGGDARGVRATAGSTPATSARSTRRASCTSAAARRR